MENEEHLTSKGYWYGFDLDGTLAVYDKWVGLDHIGEPVKPMVDLIRKMRNEGKTVKVVTARVAPNSTAEQMVNPYFAGKEKPARLSCMDHLEFIDKPVWTAADFIADWCAEHLGFIPEITHEKDSLMVELYDDRVRQVVKNKGLLVDDLLHTAYSCAREWELEYRRCWDKMNAKSVSRILAFLLGFAAAASLILVGCILIDQHFRMSKDEAAANLHNAAKVCLEARE